MATQHTHGRGGAGNINTGAKEPVNTETLATPTIKQTTYTTGRGGSGNMASNDSPENARKAQDVDTKADEREKKGTYHWGRGGEGNQATVGQDGKPAYRPQLEKRRKSSRGTPERRGSWLMEKGKEKLGLKGQKPADDNAIED